MSGADISWGVVYDTVQAIVFSTVSGAGNSIDNVRVSHFAGVTRSAHSVVFEAGSTTDTFDSVTVHGNFLVKLNLSAVMFTGAPGTFVNTYVAVQVTNRDGLCSCTMNGRSFAKE